MFAASALAVQAVAPFLPVPALALALLVGGIASGKPSAASLRSPLP